MPERLVVIVTFDGVQALDVTGPAEVFAMANRFLDDGLAPYDVELTSVTAGEVTASGGLRLVVTRRLADIDGLDTLIVSGGSGVTDAMADTVLLGGIRALSARARRTASVCTGAFLLARAGLLDGRRATTHWDSCRLLAELFPTTTVEPDAIYVRDGNVSTSAGVTAGIDLALDLVEEDHGRDLASQVARQLVVFLQRPGGQSQFSVHLESRLADRGSIRETQSWVADHLAADLSVAELAARSGMSVRNFARVFRNEVGTTPAEYVEAVRIEAVKRLLESTAAGTSEVAHACGFRSIETLHRVFKRRVGVTPGEFRSRHHR